MGGALLGRFLRALGALLRRRVETTMAVAPTDVPEPSDSLLDALYEAVREARRLAWQASLLHLQSEALEASRSSLGAPRVAPAPPEPGYSREAVRTMVRRTPGGASSPSGVARAAERHVYAASRQTVAAATSTSTPGDLLQDVEEFLGGLSEFPESIRRQVEEEVRRHERAYAGATRHDQDRVLQDIINSVSEARDRVVASRLLSREDEQQVSRVAADVVSTASGPDVVPEGAVGDASHEWWRTDSQGRRIIRPFAFARVVQPSTNGPCGFCAVLASRGPVYRSSYSAGQRVDAFHDNCRCLVVPVYTSRRWVGKADQAHYAEVYYSASGTGATGRDLINLIDRDLRSSRRAGQEEQ